MEGQAMNPVNPFSGSRYHEWSRSQPAGTMPCVLCGKPVRLDQGPPMAEVFRGGAFVMAEGPDPDESDPGYMGWFPVGPDCLRRLRSAGVRLSGN